VHFSIKTKVNVTALLFFVAMLGLFSFFFARQDATVEALRLEMERDRELFSKTHYLASHLMELETAQRAFVISGRSADLRNFEVSRGNFEVMFESLCAELKSEPECGPYLERVAFLWEEWLKDVAQPEVDLRLSFVAEESAEVLFNRRGAEILGRLRGELSSLFVVMKQQNSDRIEEIEQGVVETKRLTALGIFLGGSFAVLTALLASRLIISRLKELTRGAELVYSGRLHYRFLEDSGDEFSTLASSFNHMLDRLRSTEEEHLVTMNFLDKVLQSMRNALIVMNARGQIEKVNAAAQEMLGYSELELKELGITAILPESAEEHLFSGSNSLVERGTLHDKELCCHSKSGELIPVLFSGSVIHDEAEEVLWMVCVAQDVSVLKMEEAKTVRANEELRRGNRKLKEMQSQLVQSGKLAALGEMATGIAHELNQPLGIISMTAEMGKLGLEEDSYDSILQQVKRASHIISHLRVFGRDSSQLSLRSCEINELIVNSFILIEKQMGTLNISIRRDLQEGLPQVNCDPIKIEQVFINLLNNARDALKTVSSERFVEVCSFQRGARIVVEVRDSGPGIEQTLQERIFDPFFSTKEIGSGTGLGLSISHSIIEEHGGELTVKSHMGEGAVFTVALPV
jgi:PAS domain S-box-containing protein